ncbi:MAG: hypothetical protein DPW11_00630 [bacterium]|nr:hypothetical protein [bacterium]RIK52038.1 MAG: hypothetical protein DCC61_00505 [Candidatus Microgenomates bacterium]
MNMQTDIIERLRSDIDTIQDEMTSLLHSEDMFRNRLIPLVEKASVDVSSKRTLYQAHYTTMLLGVRRQLGRDAEEISLLKLLEKLKENHNLITKSWYSEEWLKDSSLESDNSTLSEFIAAIPNGEFEEYFGQEYLSSEIVDKDIEKLTQATESIKTFVDKRLAHRDKKDPEIVKEEEYKSALQTLEKLISKYILLLKQVGMSRLTPTMQD